MIATRCAIWRTTRRSCDTNRIASPRSRCRSSSRFRICACTETSSDDTISSAISSSGSTDRARAIAMRWRCPPENSCGSRRGAGSAAARVTAVRRCAGSAGRGHDPVHAQCLPEHLANGHAWIERAVGVLKHHLHAAIVSPQRLAAERPDIFTVEQDLPGIGLDQPHQRAGQGGLAAAGLTHHRQCLATLHCKCHAVECPHHRAPAVPAIPAHRKAAHEIVHAQQHIGGHAANSARAAPRHGMDASGPDLPQVGASGIAQASGLPGRSAARSGIQAAFGADRAGRRESPAVADARAAPVRHRVHQAQRVGMRRTRRRPSPPARFP